MKIVNAKLQGGAWVRMGHYGMRRESKEMA